MTKREIIDRIHELNRSASPEFLATFGEEDLLAYLHQLQEVLHDRRRREAAEPVMNR